jgi:hypothetical protein
VVTLDSRADQVIPDVTDETAWPTLRANLIALAAEIGEHRSSTSMKPHSGGISARLKTWPPS